MKGGMISRPALQYIYIAYNKIICLSASLIISKMTNLNCEFVKHEFEILTS